jgi:hypothetical protein
MIVAGGRPQAAETDTDRVHAGAARMRSMPRIEKVAMGGRFVFPLARPDEPWWRDRGLLSTMVQPVAAAGLWLDFDHGGRAGARLEPFASVDAPLDALSAGDACAYMFSRDASGRRDGSFFEITVELQAATPVLVVAKPDFEDRRATLLDAMEAVMAAWHAALRGRAVLRPTGGAWIFPPCEPAERPPREETEWGVAGVLDLLDPRFGDGASEEAIAAKADIAQALCTPLPAGARRTERNGAFMFRWVGDLCDEDAVMRGVAARDRWLVETLQPPVAPDWNKAGDRQVLSGRGPAHPPLVAYDQRDCIGYLAIVATDEGPLDPELLADAACWMRAGQLPDGTPLAELRLIAPVRAAAVALRQHSQPLGLPTVLYVTNDGNFWDPFPSGSATHERERPTRQP